MAMATTTTCSKRRSSSASSSGGLRLLLLHGLLALTAMHMHSLLGRGVAVEALPITSRPIEGNAQLLAWEEWVRLPHEQQSLEKQKKVTAKSIFTLPFRHCPPGHKLYNERCIPQINIDPTDLVKQELLGLVGGGGDADNGSPNGDYDYSEDEQSDELFLDVPPVPLIQTGQLPAAGEDQALPSEDAPLKFNIFEKKYPTAPEALVPDVATPSTTATSSTTTTAATATATTTALPTVTIMRGDAQPAGGTRDLQADASTTSLSLPNSSSLDTYGNMDNIDAIVLPAGLPLDEEPSVQLVASSMSDEGEANADTNTDEYTELNAEADLAQFLKVDVFHPAFGSTLDLAPPFSHRRVAPPLSASLEVDESATDIVPAADGEVSAAAAAYVTPTEINVAQALTTPTTTTASTQTRVQGEAVAVAVTEAQAAEVQEGEPILKKSKVQPVQESHTTATAAATTTRSAAETTAATAIMAATTTTTTTTNTAFTIKTKAAATTGTKTATTTAAATVVAASGAAAADAEVAAAIHQNANGKARDDDRFYYQHFNRNTAASSSSSSSSISNTTPSSNSNTYEDLDVLNDMASSDNLMTNTIVDQGDSDKTASEMNFEQELRIINELVKGKRRQQYEQQSMTNSNSNINSSSSSSTTIPTITATATTAETPVVEITADYTTSSSTAATASDAIAATDSTTIWSKLMPRQDLSSTEATTTVTEDTAETFRATATTSIIGNVVESSTAAATTTVAVAANTKSTANLSINNNRSNRNSKITRVDSLPERPTATTLTERTTAITPTASSNINLNDDDGYTPFWWLPSIGWRLERQVDTNGEDRSLLLRFFRTFGASESDTPATLPLRH